MSDNKLHEALVTNLKKIQKEMGIDRDYIFAGVLKISPAYLSQIYNGGRLGLDKLLQFSKCLKVSKCELLSFHDEKTNLMIKYFNEITENEKTYFLKHLSDIKTGKLIGVEYVGSSVLKDLLKTLNK